MAEPEDGAAREGAREGRSDVNRVFFAVIFAVNVILFVGIGLLEYRAYRIARLSGHEAGLEIEVSRPTAAMPLSATLPAALPTDSLTVSLILPGAKPSAASTARIACRARSPLSSSLIAPAICHRTPARGERRRHDLVPGTR